MNLQAAAVCTRQGRLMFITVAVIFIVLATFLLIMYNMYVDYVSRRESDLRMMVNQARNIISETEELLLNQSQIPFSKVLVLVLRHRILNALKKLKSDPHAKHIDEKIIEQQRLISEITRDYKEDLAFRPPENDAIAVSQLREIRRLRKIIYTEMRAGNPVDPVSCQKEDRRLQLLVLKVNISNLIQRTLDLKRMHQVGSCRQLVSKGLEVIKKSPIKDNWLDEKALTLTQILNDIDKEVKENNRREAEQNGMNEENKKELDELFGDKKKW